MLIFFCLLFGLTHQKDQTLDDIEALGKAMTIRLTIPELVWYLMPRFAIPPRSAENARRLRRHSEEALSRRQSLVDSSSQDHQIRPTLFSKLYRAKDDESLGFASMRDNAQIYLTAGTGTTAMSLTFLVWSVCRHEAVRRRLLDELHAHLEATGLGDDFGYEHVKDLPYLNCVIKETLRLYSAVPTGMPRVVPLGGATLAGRFLPAGTRVAVQAFSMHRNENVFPDPDCFVPERWEKPSKAMKDCFMAFGGGSRGKFSTLENEQRLGLSVLGLGLMEEFNNTSTNISHLK